MTQKKGTKRALLLSILAMVMCCSMLIGSTYAWFTDSVTSTGNKIQSGTLKLDLELLDKASGTWSSIKEAKTPLFNYSNWEPGYTEVKVLKVENEGSLALKWVAKIVTAQELSILADVIDVYVLPYGVLSAEDAATAVKYPTRALENYKKVGTLKNFVNTIEETTFGTLLEDESAYLGIALKMQESAGNDYQAKDLGGVFDIQIVATQLTYEEDTFDKDYDKDATYPVASKLVAVPENATEPMTLSTEGETPVAVTLPADLINALPDSVKEIRVEHTEARTDTVNEWVSFDNIDLVDQDGNVIDLDALNTTETVTVKLPVGDMFDAGDVVEVYHDDVKIADATVDSNGNAVYEASHFCEVKVSRKLMVVVTFTDGFEMKFSSLKKAMRTGYSNGEQEKITVYCDITEEMDFLEGNIVCGNPDGVTIKNPIVDAWIYCDSSNFTIGEGITYDATGYESGLFVYGDDCVINGTVITDCYYQRYADTKLTINAPGSLTVKTETFILRYTDNDGNAGIYINGDNNDETVEFNIAVVYFYQGMINAKDATLKVGTYWQTNETDGQGSTNLVLDNSKLTVTVDEHEFKATGNSTVTLTNGSVLDVARRISTNSCEISCDETSTVIERRK